MGGTSLLLGVGVIALWSAVGIWSARGPHWNRDAPVCVAAMIERLGLSGRLFMTNASSVAKTWLLYRFHPHIQVQQTWEYVDGPIHTAEYRAIWQEGPAALQAYLDRYRVDAMVLNLRLFWGRPPGEALPGWVFVHMDNRFVVMVRWAAARGMPVYNIIQPWANVPVTPANAHQVLDEAERALTNCPDGATFAWAYKAEALRLLGRDEESFEARLNVPEQLVID